MPYNTRMGKNRLFHFASIAAAAAALSGCGGGLVLDARNPPVELYSGGVVAYRGRTVPLEDLPRKLRGDGVRGQDQLPVRAMEGVTEEDEKLVGGWLFQKGFSRVIFVRPQAPVSYVSDGREKLERIEKNRNPPPPPKVRYLQRGGGG